MAIHYVKTVGTAPTLLSPSATHSGVEVVVQNNSGADLFLGGSDVSTSVYGFKLATASAISLRLAENEEVYGIVSGSPASINVLTVGLA